MFPKDFFEMKMTDIVGALGTDSGTDSVLNQGQKISKMVVILRVIEKGQNTPRKYNSVPDSVDNGDQLTGQIESLNQQQVGEDGQNAPRKLITGTISKGIGGQISEQTTSLNQGRKIQQDAETVQGNDQQQQNTLNQVHIGADSAGKVQEIQPAKTGQNQAVPAPMNLTVRHHYSLRADGGKIKSITPIKVEEFVAKHPKAKGNGEVSQACVYLKVADYAPLNDKVSKTLLTWAGLNLSYTGKLEVIRSVIQGIESFWLGILPIFCEVLDLHTSLCCRFLCGGNYASVSWKTMCVSSVWDLQVKKDFPPLVKCIISIRDKIIEAEGSIPNAIHRLSSGIWEVLYTHHLLMTALGPWDRERSGIELLNSINAPKFLLYFDLHYGSDFL
ncbi:hypothetical protein M9H77_12745 [Catharanthus roseus]|uniref:Uncharacterized protein n=1 Tax=Catharanthus roseus TaxID=4058 RepID=A0ACC0BIA2_CATRO|nr:hypothetical protein M9H77_12745 [Catharanthus roseus]